MGSYNPTCDSVVSEVTAGADRDFLTVYSLSLSKQQIKWIVKKKKN